jgi:hypothetical protein
MKYATKMIAIPMPMDNFDFILYMDSRILSRGEDFGIPGNYNPPISERNIRHVSDWGVNIPALGGGVEHCTRRAR